MARPSGRNRCAGELVTLRLELAGPGPQGGPPVRVGRDLTYRCDQLGEIGDKLAAFMAECIPQQIAGWEKVELHITIEPATCAVFVDAAS